MLSAVIPPKPSAEEITKAAPLRQKARQQVLDKLNTFTTNETAYKQAGLTDSDLKPLKSYLEDEVAWWNANLELSTLQVQTRQTSFTETLPTKEKQVGDAFAAILSKKQPAEAQKILNSFPKNSGFVTTTGQGSVQTQLNERKKQEDLKKKEEQEKLDKRTWVDDMKDALKYASSWAALILYLVLALRFAGFAANDVLYKPLPYRVLTFIYTFLFAFFFAPYYIYREIKGWFYPSDDFKPHFESLFPVIPYDPSEPLTFERRLYGYADTPAIREWILKKQEQEKTSWLDKLQSTVMADLIQKREEEVNPS
jgi:hypothetical protein